MNPTIFQLIEQKTNKKVRVVLNRDFGYEGVLTAVSDDPPGIWLSNADAVTFRSTLAQPLPQIANREDRSELFINLNSVLRLEVLH
jgi:small nuclear ribonucleoprotein (snRNP)-like protein